MVPDSTLQLTIRKLAIVEFWYSIKVEYPKLSEKTTKTHFSLSTKCLYKSKFSPYSSMKTFQQIECRSKLENPAVFS